MQEETYSNERLMTIAKEARCFSYAGLSGFRVGAALLTRCGKVFTGCNIEDPSGIGITNICAERCAVVKAVSEGYTDFEKIAIAGGSNELTNCLPCGACRQYLHSFNPQLIIISTEDGAITEQTINELLPKAFDESF